MTPNHIASQRPGAAHGPLADRAQPGNPPANAGLPQRHALADADAGLRQLGRPPARAGADVAQAAPRAVATLPAAMGRAPTGIARNELALAAYLTARILLGRPVSTEDIARLRSANASVDEARQRLPLGRGNVIEDVDATEGQSLWRANAARAFAHRLDRQHDVPRGDLATQTFHQAVSAATFAAGRCGEYSPVAAVLHSSRLGPDESLHIVSNVGHQWIEARLGADRDRAVVLDGWADGPPVLAPDSQHAARPESALLHYEPLGGNPPPATDPDQGRAALDGGAAAVREDLTEAGLRQCIDAQARPTARLVAAFDRMLGLGYWTQPQVLDRRFVAQAQQAAADDDLSAEIAAARVARQLGCTVETQRGDVEAILAALAHFKR